MKPTLNATVSSPPSDPAVPSARVAGNARLTALTGVLLLLLLAAQVVTVILGVDKVLTAHLVIGYVLTPVIGLKLLSTGRRIIGYYRGEPDYRKRGAPNPYFRILGPVLVLLTVILMGSGFLAYLAHGSIASAALGTHKVSFYVWLIAVLLHAVPHYVEAMRLAAADLFGRAKAHLPGAFSRRTALLAALVLGVVLAFVLTGHPDQYLLLHPKHPHH